MVPSFPHCQKSSDLLQATVRCETESSNENYTVTWKGQRITAEVTPMTPSKCIFLCSSSLPILFFNIYINPCATNVFFAGYSEGMDVYAAVTIVSCNSSTLTPQLTCTLTNRCNQETTASIDINIIHGMF